LKGKKIIYTIFFIFLTYCILTNSQLSLYYALSGLQLWYSKMIPSLLPFMIISGLMIRLHLTEGFSSLIYPIINPLFKVSKNACYVIMLGFLCGFPMGARIIADLYLRGMLSRREAEFLLSFCNNIGPVYFMSFVLPLLRRELFLPYVLGMYGLPFLYGFILRKTLYRDISTINHRYTTENMLVACSSHQKESLLYETDDAITSSIHSILSLGGYMVLFNLLNLIPHVLTGRPSVLLAPLFEISGGLNILSHRLPLYTLLILPFGGLSCIAQTYSCIRDTDLSIAKYTVHKLILTSLTAAYYLLWSNLLPESFLR